MAIITVLNKEITIKSVRDEDFISLTDIARYKDADATDDLIRNWLRNRNTLEFLGLWERLNNPGFNHVEFDGIKSQAGLNSFTLTPKQWLENLNALWIHEGIAQPERLKKLNQVAIQQMHLLVDDTRIKRLKNR